MIAVVIGEGFLMCFVIQWLDVVVHWQL